MEGKVLHIFRLLASINGDSHAQQGLTRGGVWQGFVLQGREPNSWRGGPLAHEEGHGSHTLQTYTPARAVAHLQKVQVSQLELLLRVAVLLKPPLEILWHRKHLAVVSCESEHPATAERV